jgi:hypothetical protein
MWVAGALFEAGQSVLFMRARKHVWLIFGIELASWLPWALATPLVIALARRYEIIRSTTIQTAAVHLAAFAAISLVAEAWFAVLQVLFNPWDYPQQPTFMDSWRTSLLFQVLTYLIVYALILTVTYVMDARDSMARQMTETARLSEELSKSQLAALRRQIDCIEAAGRYACLHAGNDTHIMRRTLSELERNLGEEKFILIHRSTIVQLDRIHGLELQSGGDYEVILKCKSRLPLSRRFRKRLQDRVRAM